MQAHIRQEFARLARAERESEWEAAYEADQAEAAERASENAYCLRRDEAVRRGESEDAFEAREAAAQAAEYRVVDRVNREICEIFAAAGIASARFFAPAAERSYDTTTERFYRLAPAAVVGSAGPAEAEVAIGFEQRRAA